MVNGIPAGILTCLLSAAGERDTPDSPPSGAGRQPLTLRRCVRSDHRVFPVRACAVV